MNNENKIYEDRLEGKNPILEALKANRAINKLWIQKFSSNRIDPIVSQIIDMSKKSGAVIIETEKNILDKMAQTNNHQGLIAQVAAHEYAEIEDILARCEEKNEVPMLLILDELKDSYNLGSILRIADAANVSGVIIPKHRSVGLDATVAKASAGAIEYVPVCKVTNISQTIENLKNLGFWIFGTSMNAKSDYDKADYKGKIALVIGSEGDGMKESVEKKCDFLIKIPMHGNINSLNAAVATGIVVFEAVKQRGGGENE